MPSGNAFAFGTINVLDKAVGFTYISNAQDNPHLRAIITLEGGHIRYKYNGDKPTDTSGHLMEHGDKMTIEGKTNIDNFKAVKIGNKSGILSVTYERVYV